MSGVKEFAAVNTKIRSMMGQLLTNEDYNKMIILDNEKEIFNYLYEHTYYGNIFEELDGNNISEIETRIKNHILHLYQKIMCFISGYYKKIFRLLMEKYEAEDIKSYIRKIILKDDITKFHLIHSKYHIYSKLDYKELGQSVDLKDFIEKLQGTRYYDVLRLYLNEDNERILFYMEMNIERLYFAKLVREFAKCSEDEKNIYYALQINIDFLNFQWIYRGRKFYDLSSEEILNYTLPSGKNLKYEDLKKLSYAKDEFELFELMLDSKYKKIFRNRDGIDQYVERDMNRYLYNIFLEGERSSALNMVTIVSFTNRLEYEMKDLFTIIEAKHYNVDGNELREYLIRVI